MSLRVFIVSLVYLFLLLFFVSLNTSCSIHSFVNIFVFIIVFVIIVYSLATNMISQTKLNSNTTFIGYYNTIGACYRLYGRSKHAFIQRFSIIIGDDNGFK